MKLIIICFLAISSICLINTNKANYLQTDPLKESIERGNKLYTDFCASCHLSAGEGVENVYPPLAKSDFLLKNRDLSIKIIKYGQEGEIIVNGKTYNGYMSPLGLSNDEVADVMNYIANSWGNENTKIVTEEEVSKIKK